MLKEDLALPTLRDDIQLNEAPSEPEGSPSWTLYDPAANKYYKIGWLEFECINRIKKCRSVNELVEKVTKETTLEPDSEIIENLLQFLALHNLVYAISDETLDHFEQQREKMARPWYKSLIHSYLFFTLPLFKPEKFLKKTYPFISPLFSRTFMVSMLLLLSYGIFLSIQRFDEIANTFINYLNLEGVILFVSATILVKIIHELGHAYTATKYGVPVTTIGLAFIVLYPILYTETTNAWKLKNRNNRLVIAASGMMAELSLSAVTLLLWHILPPGMGQSLCFMIAIVSMLASLLVNLNPLMKFDGYYLFSDLVGVDNLQDRSFAFAKWRLREFLWGWKKSKPEVANAKMERLLTGFGYSVWIYRFFLYLGISLLVYHLFFQPLGLILMIVELIFFICLPIFREMKFWSKNFHDILCSIHGVFSLVIIASIISIAFIPIQDKVEIPATLHSRDYTRFYAPIPAKIEEIKIVQGQNVNKGDILFRLSSPKLNHNINITRQKLKDLEAIRDSSQATPVLANERSMIGVEIENTREELKGFQAIQNKLTIKAPFSANIKMMDVSLKKGQWISTSNMLALLADDDTKILSGYVLEKDMKKLSDVNKGIFYTEYSPFVQYDVILTGVEKTGADTLFWPELSSIQGGSIPSERIAENSIRPLPRYTVYPVHFELTPNIKNDLLPEFVARGTVTMTGNRQILANTLFKKGISMFIMNGGF